MEKNDNDTKKDGVVEKNDRGKNPGCGCCLLLVAFLGVCSGLYSYLFPDIKGIGSIRLGEVATNTYNNASTDFMHFESCTWLATVKSLKTYAACYETNGYNKFDLVHLIEVLRKEYSLPAVESITNTDASEVAENKRITIKNKRITMEKMERLRSATMVLPADESSDNSAMSSQGCAEVEHLRRILKRDHERWVLRLKIDESSGEFGDDRHNPMSRPAVLRFIYNTFMFCRNLLPQHKRHIAVFERKVEGEKEKTPDGSARENPNRFSVILIVWDDDLLAENAKESR